MPALWRRACSTRAMRACPATCSRAELVHHACCRGLRAATSAPARCASAPRCSSLASRATSPPSSSGLRPLRISSAARARACTTRSGSGSIDDERVVDQRQEVGLHPRHAGELRPVGHLVDRDPQPEVARAEREPLLEREDVGADVVDGVGRGRRRRARAGRTGRARAARTSRAARRARCRRRAGRSARPGCAAMRSPTRAVSGASRRCIDATLASTHAAAVDDLRRARGPGARSPVYSATSASASAVTASKSSRSDSARYEPASGSRPAMRRATRSASAQSIGSCDRAGRGRRHADRGYVRHRRTGPGSRVRDLGASGGAPARSTRRRGEQHSDQAHRATRSRSSRTT